MPVEIIVNPSFPNITVSNNPSLITPDLSNYVTISNLENATGTLDSSADDKIASLSGVSIIDGYISNIGNDNTNINLITQNVTGISARLYLDTFNNTNVFGSSFRGRRFRGDSFNPSGVLKNDILLQLVGDGYSESGNIENAVASISFFAAEDFRVGKHGGGIRMRTTPSGGASQIERLVITDAGTIAINNFSPDSNYKLDVSGGANFIGGVYLDGLPIEGIYATINYINYISGELKNQIQTGGGGSGITSLNNLDGVVGLVSSSDFLSFQNAGNNIDIQEKPQSITLYRNGSSQITGVRKNVEFIKIYRNNEDKITGVYYNNFYKKILLDGQNNITGVDVIYI